MSQTDLPNPPGDLPTTPAAFWGETMAQATPPASSESEPVVLDQLGAPPFMKIKGGFPFLGFLASVYEHVATIATRNDSRP